MSACVQRNLTVPFLLQKILHVHWNIRKTIRSNLLRRYATPMFTPAYNSPHTELYVLLFLCLLYPFYCRCLCFASKYLIPFALLAVWWYYLSSRLFHGGVLFSVFFLFSFSSYFFFCFFVLHLFSGDFAIRRLCAPFVRDKTFVILHKFLPLFIYLFLTKFLIFCVLVSRCAVCCGYTSTESAWYLRFSTKWKVCEYFLFLFRTCWFSRQIETTQKKNAKWKPLRLISW